MKNENAMVPVDELNLPESELFTWVDHNESGIRKDHRAPVFLLAQRVPGVFQKED